MMRTASLALLLLCSAACASKPQPAAGGGRVAPRADELPMRRPEQISGAPGTELGQLKPVPVQLGEREAAPSRSAK